MNALYASHNQRLYTAGIRTLADIAELSRGGPHLETLSSTDNAFIFYHRATELLPATTRFAGRDVPLLHGDVRSTGSDSHGNFTALTDRHIHQLANTTTPWSDDLLLTRRCDRDHPKQRLQPRKGQPANIFDSAPF